MKKATNTQGISVFLLSPPVLWIILAQITARIPTKFWNFLKVQEFMEMYMNLFLAFALGLLFMWQLTKRLKNPELSDKFMIILVGMFSLKGVFADFMRLGFNPWASLWLFAPFLLVACARGEGWQYLKKYLWYPIMLDGLVLIYRYWFGNLSETLKGVTVIDLMILLFAYVAVFVGFVKYTTWTYAPAKPRWYIPTAILAIPAFTIGLFIIFLFLIMF